MNFLIKSEDIIKRMRQSIIGEIIHEERGLISIQVFNVQYIGLLKQLEVQYDYYTFLYLLYELHVFAVILFYLRLIGLPYPMLKYPMLK